MPPLESKENEPSTTNENVLETSKGEDLESETVYQAESEKVGEMESVNIGNAEASEESGVTKELKDESNSSKEDIDEQMLSSPTDMDPELAQQEAANEQTIEQLNIAERVTRSFQEKFNITSEQLESMEGFADLSEGQQLLVLENLSQLTLGRIQEEAADAHTSAYAQQIAGKGFLGKMWQGLKENMGGKQVDTAAREQATAAEIFEGGIQSHKETLQELVHGMQENGPNVLVNERGGLEIEFAEMQGLDAEGEKIRSTFNSVANEISRIPYEWSLDTATDKQRADYKNAIERFESAKAELFKLKEKSGEDEKDIYASMAKIENQVQMSQFLSTHPHVESELMKMREQNGVQYALNHVYKAVGEKGAYFALGYAGRSLLAGALSWAAAPVTAAAIGGIRGAQRAHEQVREIREKARRGVHQEGNNQKLERNMVAATGENGLQSKLAKLLDTVEKLDMNMAQKGGESEEMVQEKQKKIDSLKARIHYTERKIAEGLVDFGGDNRVHGQYELTKAIGRARGMVDMLEGGDATSERLDSLLDFRKDRFEDARKWFIRKQAIKGATMAAGFAGAGAMSAAAAQGGEDIAVSADDIRNGMEEVLGTDTSPDVVQSGITSAENDAYVQTLDGYMVEGDPAEFSEETPLSDEELTAIKQLKEQEHDGGLTTRPETAVSEPETPSVDEAINQTIEDEKMQKPSAAQEAAPASDAGQQEGSPTSNHAIEQMAASVKHTVQPGDNIWKIIENRLGENGQFAQMNEAQQTYVIDDLKDKFEQMNPDQLRAIGIESGNAQLIKPGEIIDLSKAFGDSATLDSAMGRAGQLSQSQMESIIANNARIASEALEQARNVAESVANVTQESAGVVDTQSVQELSPEQMKLVEEAARKGVEVQMDKLFSDDSGLIDLKGTDTMDWKELRQCSVREIMNKEDFSQNDIFDDGDYEYGPPSGIDSPESVGKAQAYIKQLEQKSGIAPQPLETLGDYALRVQETMVSNVLLEQGTIADPSGATEVQGESMETGSNQGSASETNHNQEEAYAANRMPENHTVESSVENIPQNTVYRNPDVDFKAHFVYDSEGRVSDVNLYSPEGGDLTLKPGAYDRLVGDVLDPRWKFELANPSSMNYQSVRNEALSIGVQKTLLEEMEAGGHGKTPEYKHVQQALDQSIREFKHKWGDILR